MADDPIGALLLDVMHAGAPVADDAQYEVVRDDGQVFTIDVASLIAGPNAWSLVDRWMLRQLVEPVLDIGCGGGRYLRECHSPRSLGIEPSPGAAEYCTRSGLRVKRDCIEATREGDRVAGFSTILLAGQNVGLLRSFEGMASTFADWGNRARPGTRIVASGQSRTGDVREREVEYGRRRRRIGESGDSETIRLRYRSHVGPWFRYLFPSADAVVLAADSAGWSVTALLKAGLEYGIVLTKLR